MVAIGSSRDDTFAEDGGVVYLFDLTSGELITTYVDPTPGLKEEFGRDMDVSDGKLWITAPGKNTDYAGAAYAFELPQITSTDDAGGYAFADLEAGDYQIRGDRARGLHADGTGRRWHPLGHA